MGKARFEWDAAKYRESQLKHGVDFVAAQFAFVGPRRVIAEELNAFALPDAQAAKHGHLRVIDESGEDYLYPQEFFATVDLPQPVRRHVLQAT